MSDIFGATEQLAVRINDGIPINFKVKDSASSTRVNDQTYGKAFTSEFTTDRRKVRYLIKDKDLKLLSQVGISNPLLLAWELVPYSFVIDWLIPVGDYLGRLDSLNGVSDLTIGKSVMWETDTIGDVRSFPGAVRDYRFSTNRSTSSSIPIPNLAYRPSTSMTAVANGVALLRQLL
jgi:hypothetical protein